MHLLSPLPALMKEAVQLSSPTQPASSMTDWLIDLLSDWLMAEIKLLATQSTTKYIHMQYIKSLFKSKLTCG